MLYDYDKYFINYLILLYGGAYKIIDTILFMDINGDIFKINLLDKNRFNEYTVYHKNHKANHGYWHKQMVVKDLSFALYRCFTHSFNLENDIPYDKNDWIRFKQDALKYKILN